MLAKYIKTLIILFLIITATFLTENRVLASTIKPVINHFNQHSKLDIQTIEENSQDRHLNHTASVSLNTNSTQINPLFNLSSISHRQMMVWSVTCISVLFVLVIIAVAITKPWKKRQRWESDDELRQQLIDSGIYRPKRKLHLLKFVSSHKKTTSRRYNFHKLKYNRKRDAALEAIHEENENTAQEMTSWPPTTA